MTSAALVTRHVGQCPICEGDFKLDASSLLVHHGYRRPGYGHIVGDCVGVGAPPYEVSCDATRVHRENVLRAGQALRTRLQALAAGHVARLSRPSWQGGGEVTPDSPHWPRAVELAREATEAEIRALDVEVERLARLIERWTPQPLRSVVELARKADADREARRTKAESDRAAKLEAKIQGYRNRIATAVRRRTASTIADIFESAPRQLGDMAHVSQAGAFALLDRTAVFEAFGLDVHGDRRANDTILGRMRYNWDKDFVWPASLTSDVLP